MESASSIAIGSSMIESGLRASFARTRRVSSAVSETPVNTVPSALAVGVEVIESDPIFRGRGVPLNVGPTIWPKKMWRGPLSHQIIMSYDDLMIDVTELSMSA